MPIETPGESSASFRNGHKERPYSMYLIEGEREKQIRWRGYDAKHDNQHDSQELLYAAIGLLLDIVNDQGATEFQYEMGDQHPWMLKLWQKDRHPIKKLVVAAALIAAEIDRLHYMASQKDA